MSQHRQNHKPDPAPGSRMVRVLNALLAITLGIIIGALAFDWLALP